MLNFLVRRRREKLSRIFAGLVVDHNRKQRCWDIMITDKPVTVKQIKQIRTMGLEISEITATEDKQTWLTLKSKSPMTSIIITLLSAEVVLGLLTILSLASKVNVT